MSKLSLVIAEKPSVAQSIATALGVTHKHNGYLEGNGYLVSWCFGHLAGLANADYYEAGYAKWKKEDLPILPSPFRFLVSEDKKQQFDLLKELMHRENVLEVINACDAGREGELIFRSVFYLADCQKPMKRLWISSMEDEAIREGFRHLKSGQEYDGLYQAALCRVKADWLVGINATRFFTLIYSTKLNVGRVLSPTLAILVQRETEIAAFVPEKHYTVNLEFAEFTASSIKFPCKANAQSALKKAREGTATVKSIIIKDKQEKAPALYDLTTLQRDANRILGFTAQQTLDYAQSLYEKKLCTYPRTDSRYLTDDMLESVEAAVFSAAAVLKMEYPEIVNKEQICNSQKVTDHHAIVPTQTVIDFDLSSLPSGEQKLLSLIARQTLIAVSDPYEYQDSEITISCSDIIFTANLKKIVNAGWKKYTSNGGKQKWFSGLRVGQKLIPEKESIKEGSTQPPHHYTEDLLLSAMESAGSKDMPEDAERKGLGTPATRAGILEKLVSTGFVERTKVKKQTHLIPTAIGKSLITILPEELQSPEMTAEWEHNLSKVQQGTLDADYFMDRITELVTDLIATYEPVAGSEILFPSATAAVGKCPRCGSKVIDRAKGYLCENRECSFGLWKNNRFFSAKKKVLTREIAAEFLETRQSMLTGCHSSKTGKIYDALAVMEDDGKHTEFRLVFNNE